MTPLEFAAQYFPDFTQAELEHVIWANTGFPCFWRGQGTPEECFKRDLYHAKLVWWHKGVLPVEYTDLKRRRGC